MTTHIPTHRTRYDSLSRILHWVVAIGIIYITIVGYTLHFMTNPQTFTFFSELNMSLATFMVPLMVFRFCWRFFRPSVPYDAHISGYKKGMVVLLHEIFYLLIFMVLISGFLMLEHGYSFFGLMQIPQPLNNPPVNHFFFIVHRYSCIALALMLIMHIAAVIKHQLIDKYPILSRMM